MSGGTRISYFDEITQDWVTVSATNPFPVDATVNAQAAAVATAANPAYVEGTPEPLSQTLFGGLRVTLLEPDGTPYTAGGGGGGGDPAVATALAPAYVEGDTVPLSVTLDGFLRGQVRQSGSWIVGQDGPWNVGQDGAWVVGQDGAWSVGVTGTVDIEGAGTAGAPAGGVVTVQGDAAGDPIPVSEAGVIEACAVSATTTLGGAGAAGDELFFVTVYPLTTSPGNVIVLDNGVAVATFPGGAASVSNLVPFILPIYARSAAGPWSVTCGANVRATASGRFT